MKKIFIDGGAGTTGLRIKDRLSLRKDLELITLPEDKRKETEYRKQCINEADIAVLCLPDDAARQAVSLLENENTVIIDTSTAHRTDAAFTYGFPEIKDFREKIRNSKRIANPGCHASGFISLIFPLIAAGVLENNIELSCFSLTGYSGGGKKMIAEYESAERSSEFNAPRLYGLSQNHKHLPEMMTVCGLAYAPAFCPIVADYYSGMEVTVPLFKSQTDVGIKDIKKIYSDYYKDGLVYFKENEQSLLSACELSGFDDMQITVEGNEERILLVSRFDNLGKGASGAAIQNINICLGIDEDKGLRRSYD